MTFTQIDDSVARFLCKCKLTVNNLYPKQAPKQSAITYTNAISGLTIPNIMVAAVTAGFKCAPLMWINIYIILPNFTDYTCKIDELFFALNLLFFKQQICTEKVVF